MNQIRIHIAQTEEAAKEFWRQLYHLQDSYRQEIGEPPLTDGDKERLARAVEQGQITFLTARRATWCVGMCSVSTLFSTYGCRPMAVFEDFYVEPAWRHKGTARLLAGAAQDWCRGRGISSLWVGCAPCDRAMYQALGFKTPLGELLTWSAP